MERRLEEKSPKGETRGMLGREKMGGKVCGVTALVEGELRPSELSGVV
jgi:hypothetical protein